MLLFAFLRSSYLWVLAWLLQSIGYYFVLKKMGEEPSYAIIPFLAEWRLTKRLYPYQRSFFRPFLIALILIVAGVYLNPFRGIGRLYILIAGLIYLGFLFRLYNRLRKAFGKSFIWIIFYVIFPPAFLLLLGIGKNNTYVQPVFPEDQSPKLIRFLKTAAVFLLSAAEIVAVGAVVIFFTIRSLPPRFLVNDLIKDVDEMVDGIAFNGSVLSREEILGDNAGVVNELKTSRDFFFPTHENDKNVVVLQYIVGSNLENSNGMASINIKQMIESTTKGEHLTYVLQAGGSSRWFTQGIYEDSYGRYVIQNGKLEPVQLLDSSISMSEKDSLEDFLKWAKEAYPADRYMLVLWDHGGGFSLGFGVDDLNKKQNGSTMLMHDLVDAIKNSGMKFDLIGFDACLMQTIENAVALEPYADYYLASEEVEGGLGWYYTEAFGKLAQDPTIPTVEFGKELIGTFDELTTRVKDGEIDTMSTLSLVDLRTVKPIYEELEKLFTISKERINEDPEYFADVSLAARNAYTFQNNEQIDLIHYLTILEALDYDNRICEGDACLTLADHIKASIPYRNKNSAQGINGMALTFPVSTVTSYTDSYKQLKAFSMDDQMKFYNDFFSIMGAQNIKSASQSNSIFSELTINQIKNAEWYVPGYENYDTTVDTFVDIPLTETEQGYLVELPEKVNKLISDVQVAVYQRDGGRLRYLGRDYIGFDNTSGDILIDMDDNWVHINNNLISYTAGQARMTDEGMVYTGTTRAILNGDKKITLHIEWDPIPEGASAPAQGKVLGYSDADDELAFMEKGYTAFQPGDRIGFLFEYQNADGKTLSEEKYGNTLFVTNPNRLVVSDKKLDSSDIVFYGVLTDIYQRELTTERVEYHVE
ncbi:MAG: hypothetical protein J6D29_05645 [Solobacterium sp.]|nr:hypothetical protein [Solobacterium sp.]